MFADPAVAPVALDQGGGFADYLTVAIRVRGDLARAEEAIRAVAARADTPRYLRRRLERWAANLAELRAAPAAGSRLERAAALAERAQSLADFPLADDGAVLDLQASALLHQEVEARQAARGGVADDLELARAFWLLGVLEERTVAPFWFPQTEAYMEATLRAAPRGPLAERAVERIEESLILDYGAIRIEDLPEQARRRLEELARLAAAPRP
jgi:hypothetical protein